MITPEELLERLNPWIAMPIGLHGAKDETLTRLKRLTEVLSEMQEQQLVARERAWTAVLNMPDVSRMYDVVVQVLDEFEEERKAAVEGDS